jgi:NAD(P)-dependent dehydrogenase (short-subunit alcohol dehydrogenase family)
MTTSTPNPIGLLTDKIALVTGIGREIGATSAKLFAEHGARVVLTARTESQLAATTAGIRAAGGTADYVVTDLTQVAGIEAAVRFAVDTYGRLDVALNNGGIAIPQVPIIDTEEDDFDRIVATNFKGVNFLHRFGGSRHACDRRFRISCQCQCVGSYRGAANLAAYTEIKRMLALIDGEVSSEASPVWPELVRSTPRLTAVLPG